MLNTCYCCCDEVCSSAGTLPLLSDRLPDVHSTNTADLVMGSIHLQFQLPSLSCVWHTETALVPEASGTPLAWPCSLLEAVCSLVHNAAVVTSPTAALQLLAHLAANILLGVSLYCCTSSQRVCGTEVRRGKGRVPVADYSLTAQALPDYTEVSSQTAMNASHTRTAASGTAHPKVGQATVHQHPQAEQTGRYFSCSNTSTDTCSASAMQPPPRALVTPTQCGELYAGGMQM